MNTKSWLKKHLSYDTNQIFDQLAWSYLCDCKEIIDVACGSGRFIAIDPHKIQGIDNNSRAVAFCKDRGYNVIKGDALDLPYEDESFEGVHCSHLIEHLYPEDAWKLIKELTRILKPKGILCLRAPLMSRHFYNDISHIRPYPPQALMEYLSGNWHHYNPLSFDEIKGSYKLLNNYYRHLPLFSGIVRQPFLRRVLEVFAKFGIRSLHRSGYLMIIEKNRS